MRIILNAQGIRKVITHFNNTSNKNNFNKNDFKKEKYFKLVL